MLEQNEVGVPRIFQDLDTIHTIIAVVHHWVEAARWWKSENHRDMFQILTEHAVYELEEQDEKWRIYRIFD